MTNKEEVSKLRSQLLANGFTPLANKDKRCFLPSWPKLTVDDKTITKWRRMHGVTATGLRVENGLCVIDIDIDHPIIEDLAEAMLSVLPDELQPYRLERRGKGHKLAWYCRTDDLFARLHTRSWVAPDDTEDDGTHTVEIFGGGSPRQFGSYGAHTIGDDGKVKVSYRWTDESPADVPLDALDIISKDQLFAMLDAAEAELKLQGFTPVARTKRGEGTPGREYDLTNDMLFDLLDGRTVGLVELQAMVEDGYHGNCSASWLDGPIAKNRNRCLISQSGSGHLTIWESAAGVTHMPAAIKPTDNTKQVDRIAEKLRETADRRRAALSDGDDHVSGAAKLLVSYAYVPTAQKPVVPLWSVSDDEATTLQNFRTQMMPYCGVEIGARGGEKKINPVDVWLSNPQRILAAGQRMRPDRERPVFEEYGRTWLNTYRPPDHGAADGGTADGGVALLEQLLPDARERAWFTQWLAYKWRHPHVPGPAVIMVARDTGTGRGTFAALLKLLFGDQYVAPVPFNIFTGQNYQSQYTEWALNALFAVVNESSATGDMSQYKAKHNVYEHLKEIVEVRGEARTYIIKGEGSVKAVSSMSSLIFTNNIDAIPLPADDRRFAVLSNGEKREPAFWTYVNDWMAKQANIAAFAKWLEEVDLSSYDPYAVPIATGAKDEMVEMNKSPLDMLLHEALESTEGFFVLTQVMRRMAVAEMRKRINLPSNWRGIATKEIQRRACACRNRAGRKIETQINGVTYYPLHKDAKIAKNCTVPTEVIRRAIIKNGDV